MPLARRDCLRRLAAGALPFAPPRRPPNVLLILTDDHGYGDLSLHGNPHLRTPNLDRLARQGLEFTRFYVSPVCAPTRASLLTGRYNLRCGVWGVTHGKETMRPEETTLAQTLRQAGYRTALIGKWHLGSAKPEFLPNRHGFDHYDGFLHGCIDYFDFTYGGMPSWFRNEKPFTPPRGYTTNYLTDQAIAWLRRNQPNPFFLYLPYNAPHYGKGAYDPKTGKASNVLQAPEEYLRRFAHIQDEKRRVYAAMVAALDDNIGRLLQSLRELRLEENTLVVFISDNGGATGFGGVNTPLRGHKSQLFEGGIRVPAVMQWKGRIAPGRRLRQPAGSVDLFPTFCALAGISPPANLDGRDLRPVLFENRAFERDLFWRTERDEAYLLGDRKYIRAGDGQEFLFDLARDPRETDNLIGDAPALRKIKAAYEKVRASMPL
jgi:arylsulfatase A